MGRRLSSVSVDVPVDTTPIAESIDKLSLHVRGTSAAVVDFRNTIALAEEQATQRICDDVNRGFYSLIRSQIGQKVAKLNSQIEAQQMLLMTQGRQLQQIRVQMERDYRGLCQRYSRLFGQLNDELSSRIRAIDQPILDLAERDQQILDTRPRRKVATLSVSSSEVLPLNQTILASQTKSRAFSVLQGIQDFIAQRLERDASLERLRFSQSASQSAHYYTPYILMERAGQVGTLPTETYVSGQAAPELQDAQTKRRVSEATQGQWTASEPLDRAVKSAFLQRLEQSQLSPEVRKYMLEMLERTNPEVLRDQPLAARHDEQ